MCCSILLVKKMLSQFSSPFHSWDTPFNSPSRLGIPTPYEPNQTNFTMAKAEDLKEISKNYFSVSSYKACELRTSYPNNTFTHSTTTINNQVLEIQLSTSTRTFSQPFVQQCDYFAYYLRLMGTYLRFGNYKPVVERAKKAMQTKTPDHVLITFLGYIAALCMNDVSDFDDFIQEIEKSFFSNEDLPHYFRLIDEMIALRQQPDIKTPLLNLVLPNTHELATHLKSRIQIFPRISCDINKLISRYEITKKPSLINNKVNEMYEIINKTRKALPPLMPLAEGFGNLDDVMVSPSRKPSKFRSKSKQKHQALKTQGSNPTDKVLAFIQKKEWLNAIQAATEIIDQNKNDDNMLQHRAYALMKYSKNHDAIIDISRAIEIKKTDVRLKMRAAMWLTLGERKLSMMDLQALEEKDPKLSNYDENIEVV